MFLHLYIEKYYPLKKRHISNTKHFILVWPIFTEKFVFCFIKTKNGDQTQHKSGDQECISLQEKPTRNDKKRTTSF